MTLAWELATDGVANHPRLTKEPCSTWVNSILVAAATSKTVITEVNGNGLKNVCTANSATQKYLSSLGCSRTAPPPGMRNCRMVGSPYW